MKKYIVKIIPALPDLPYYIGCPEDREEWYETPFAEQATCVIKSEHKVLLEDLAERWIKDSYENPDVVKYEIEEVEG